MDAIAHFLQPFDLHPIVDHFTVALLIVGVGVDIVASFFPSRAWMRYMALSLMILGAIAAGSSYLTGEIEADRIWKGLAQPARDVLHRHAEFAEYLTVVFAVLALWRILIEAVGFFAGSRPLYLIVAILAAGVLGYVGHLGGELVYTFGAGTEIYPSVEASASATPAATPAAPGAVPTVTVPSPAPSAASPAASSSAVGSPEAKESPKTAESPQASPAAKPTGAAL
jgi:uncharacterized membrane protein